jgi:uncharacterized protein (DUF362 family)
MRAAVEQTLRYEIARTDQPVDVLEHLRAVGHPEVAEGGMRIAVKPNLTWIDPRPGVTTSLEVMREVLTALAGAGNEISIVESNGGYGTFSADDSLTRHGFRDLAASLGGRAVNLSTQPTERVDLGGLRVDMASTLLHEVDLLINMPVPKVHAMTRFTGAFKNQWGLIPTDMRLRMHYRLPRILGDMRRVLPAQAVIADGTFFLDQTGPLEGHPVRKDILIFASEPVLADMVALRLMGWRLREVPYIHQAAQALGISTTVELGLPPLAAQRFTLRRSVWNYIGLVGFKSRAVTYVGYESSLAGPLHSVKSGVERLMARRGSPTREDPQHRFQ